MQAITETVHSDALHVVEARAAGLDVHKLQVTASIRSSQVQHALPTAVFPPRRQVGRPAVRPNHQAHRHDNRRQVPASPASDQMA